MPNTRTDTYNVAFRGTSKENGYAGVVTWTPFASKAAFDEYWRSADQTIQEIVEEGITDNRAAELVRTTPLQSYINAAIMSSRDPITGDFDLTYMNNKLESVRYLEQVRTLTAA